MELLISLIVEAVFGLAGGTLINSLKAASIRAWRKYLSGAVGGIIGGMILTTVIAGGPGSVLDFASFVAQIVGGVVGGGILTAIVGAVMKSEKNDN